MIHLLIAVALGVALAVGGAFAASNTLTSVVNGAPINTGTADPAGRW